MSHLDPKRDLMAHLFRNLTDFEFYAVNRAILKHRDEINADLVDTGIRIEDVGMPELVAVSPSDALGISVAGSLYEGLKRGLAEPTTHQVSGTATYRA